MQDGIASFDPYVTSGAESKAVKDLTRVAALDDDQVFYGLISKPWLRDGVTANEARAVSYLVYTAILGWTRADSADEWTQEGSDPESVVRILEMPFLDTLEAHEAYVTAFLYVLHSKGNRYLEQTLDHLSFRGGITDEDAVVLSGLRWLVYYSPESLDDLMAILDPSNVYVERRTVELPLAGEITLTFMRLTPGEFETMDIVEEIVREMESFMGVAYPYDVTVFNIIPGGPMGSSRYGLMWIQAGFEERYWVLAHELAHSYWNVPSEWQLNIAHTPFTWLIEGGAQFMEQWVTGGLDDAPSTPEDTGCALADTIGEIDQRIYGGGFEGDSYRLSGCKYTMGYGIFASLYKELGDAEFRRGFGSLYLKMSQMEHDAECSGVERGVCYVKKAFVEEASPGFADVARAVIDHWYYGNE